MGGVAFALVVVLVKDAESPALLAPSLGGIPGEVLGVEFGEGFAGFRVGAGGGIPLYGFAGAGIVEEGGPLALFQCEAQAEIDGFGQGVGIFVVQFATVFPVVLHNQVDVVFLVAV